MNLFPTKGMAIFIFFLLSATLSAQHTISGTFSPAEDFKWLIAYELTPSAQRYVADTAVANGTFTLNIPKNAPAGTYRLVYAIPQDEFYFDVLYSGKEDIVLHFNWDDGVIFEASEENKAYREYTNAMDALKLQILEEYAIENPNKKAIMALVQQQEQLQKSFETKSEGLLAGTFIAAGKPYAPKTFEPLNTYLQHRKDHFFSHMAITDPLVQASSFLTNSITTFTFALLSPTAATQNQAEQDINNNVNTVYQLIKDTPKDFQVKLFYELWKTAHDNQLGMVEDHIFTSYLHKLALDTGKEQLANELANAIRLRIGNPAPEIQWEAGGSTKTLKDLPPAKTYLLVFWSSTCSHCLKELPQLHGQLKDLRDLRVLAIGLEDEAENWQKERMGLPNFEHALSLGKWQSKYAQEYGIQKTPTYVVLDQDKHIIAKPDTYEDLLAFLQKNSPKG